MIEGEVGCPGCDRLEAALVIAIAALQWEQAQATYTNRKGQTWCRNRHDNDHGGFHGPGLAAEDRHLADSSVVLACATCRTYKRIADVLGKLDN